MPWATGAAVLMDGGVRTGSDVLKAVALGARAVLVGALLILGLGLGGEAGVRGGALRNLLADTDLTLAMSGLSSIGQVDRELLVEGVGAGRRAQPSDRRRPVAVTRDARCVQRDAGSRRPRIRGTP